MRISTALGAAVSALAGAAALTACGGADDHNPADIAFAQQMVPHHQQAVQMADLVPARTDNPRLRQLADGIRGAQAPEIQQMTGWLKDWSEPVPETMRDHANAHSDDGMGDLESMEGANGPRFEQMWLEAMIEHHEGAVAMAEDEQADGTFGPALDLAESIASSQQDEIEHMEDMLTS